MTWVSAGVMLCVSLWAYPPCWRMTGTLAKHNLRTNKLAHISEVVMKECCDIYLLQICFVHLVNGCAFDIDHMARWPNG